MNITTFLFAVRGRGQPALEDHLQAGELTAER
jgi:hypothetical protein